MLLGFFRLSESTVFKNVQKAVYSIRNKPVCEFKNWCVTTLLQEYVIYPTQLRTISIQNLRETLLGDSLTLIFTVVYCIREVVNSSGNYVLKDEYVA